MKGPAGTSPRAGRPPALIQPGMSRVRFSATALTGQKKKNTAPCFPWRARHGSTPPYMPRVSVQKRGGAAPGGPKGVA